jgi:hypothetical protein
MKIKKVTLPKGKINELSPEVRGFFFLAGHMQNEICSLTKVFHWCINDAPNSDRCSVQRVGRRMQGLIYARILSGKLLEAWEAIKKVWFGTGISRTYQPRLCREAEQALGNIKRYFGSQNLIYRIRNSHSFHYSTDGIEDIWKEMANSSNFQIILGGTTWNNFNLAAEMVVNGAMMITIDPDSTTEQLELFFRDFQDVAVCFSDFLEGAILLILEDIFDQPLANVGIEEDIEPVYRFNETSINYFYNHPDQ